MKRALILILVSLFLMHLGIRAFYFITWKIYQKEITELYCINKDKPEMHCEGKCYLSIQLKALANEYQNSKLPFPPVNGKPLDVLLWCPEPEKADWPIPSFSKHTKAHFLYAALISFDSINSTFHPPEMLSKRA